MTSPCDLSAVGARRLIGTKELSPVELLEACIARIEAVNPTVNAVVATCYERAREEAGVSAGRGWAVSSYASYWSIGACSS